MKPKKSEVEKKRAVVSGLPARPAIGDPAKVERRSGTVVIRLTAEASPVGQDKAADTLVAHAKMYMLEGLSKVLESAGTPASHRLVHSGSGRKILAMEREAVQTKYPPLHSLTQYWRLDVQKAFAGGGCPAA